MPWPLTARDCLLGYNLRLWNSSSSKIGRAVVLYVNELEYSRIAPRSEFVRAGMQKGMVAVSEDGSLRLSYFLEIDFR